MARVVALARIKSTALRFVRPGIRHYNRLEGSPRSREFERNLAMETHDPLWFLCRQWQFGEFEGEDAGTACQANVLGVHSTPGEVIVRDGEAVPLEPDQPLETYVERESLRPTLFLRAQMGRYFARILTRRRLKRYVSLFAEAFPIDTAVAEDDEEGIALALALSDRIPDGYSIWERINGETFNAFVRNHPDVQADHRRRLRRCASEFFDWFFALYQQPFEDESAWDPSRLEYNFQLATRSDTGGVRRLIADQYASGHLDWKDFDQVVDAEETDVEHLPETEETVQTFIPTQLRFAGMPHPRLWQLEDAEINFGKVDASPTSILNVLLAQFGLNYSNDWFVLPYELPINTVCEIRGIVVKDVFGQYSLVRPAVDDPESRWQDFAMFHQTERDNATHGRSLFYLPPAVGQILESEDVERVNFIRDEMSNMVWAIEQSVASAVGMGRQLKRHVPSLTDFEPVGDLARIRYVLGNTVPDNWIPFIPVHKPVAPGQTPKEIRLQRARMPQAGGALGKILTEIQPVYFIEEEEVPRSGAIVSRRFQRTRWLDGRVILWMGRRKQAGRGEGMANLVFDSIVPIDDGT